MFLYEIDMNVSRKNKLSFIENDSVVRMLVPKNVQTGFLWITMDCIGGHEVHLESNTAENIVRCGKVGLSSVDMYIGRMPLEETIIAYNYYGSGHGSGFIEMWKIPPYIAHEYRGEWTIINYKKT